MFVVEVEVVEVVPEFAAAVAAAAAPAVAVPDLQTKVLFSRARFWPERFSAWIQHCTPEKTAAF